ncbi:MAG: LPS assembly lipoprotein LptE [Opitutaceae bacterium]
MRSFCAVSVSLFALIALCGSGCSHYQLGTGSQTGFRTLYVEPVENAAGLPQAVALVTTHIREAFLRDGRVTLASSAAEADATLSIRLTRYQRDVATVLPNDTGLARKFDLTLRATATLKDNRTASTLFTDRPLEARRQAYTDDARSPGNFGQQRQSEYQAMPLLAESIAKSALGAVLDRW